MDDRQSLTFNFHPSAFNLQPEERVRLLLVEDNEDDVLVTRRAFRAAAPHVEIEVVKRGEQAIEMTGTGDYDVVVVDYSLPIMNGMEVLLSVARTEIPVIMVTGRGDQKLAVEALKAGAADYLV